MTTPVDPMPGDFAVTTIVGPVGLLIRLGQFLNGEGFRNWEHAFVYVGDGQLVEAEPGGARLAGLDEYAGRPIAWSTSKVELTDEQRVAVVAAARGFLGVGYAWTDYLALALWHFHLRLPWARKVMASRTRLICSQLVDASVEAAGVKLFTDGREPGDVTPADLAALIDA